MLIGFALFEIAKDGDDERTLKHQCAIAATCPLLCAAASPDSLVPTDAPDKGLGILVQKVDT
jgi:hypothetical protein